MAEMKELKELEVFLVDSVCLIIKELKEHTGKPVEAVRDVLMGLIAEKMRTEGVAAFTGLSNLSAEFKLAGIEGWVDFAANFVSTAVPAISEAMKPAAPVAG
jgi:dihydrodipicolinate synthase/N-acetylneuraminate lyase